MLHAALRPLSLTEVRQLLAREHDGAGAALVVQRHPPRFTHLVSVGWTQHEQVGNAAQRGEMFDGLVRGAVFAESDGIVREHVDGLHTHEPGETNGGTHVVAEHEERTAVRNHAAVQPHAIHDRAHGVLTNAEVHVAAVALRGAERMRPLHVGEVAACEVGAATEQLGHHVGDGVDHHAAGRAAGHVAALRVEGGERLLQLRGELAAHATLELCRQLRVCGHIGRPRALPIGVRLRTLRGGVAPMRERLLRYEERFAARPAVGLLGERDFVLAQRFAVRLGRVLPVGRAEANVRLGDDERGALRLGLRGGDGRVDGREIIHVGHVQHLPAVRLEALGRIITAGERRAAVDGDAVVVEEADELAELEIARVARRLVRDALHETAVTSHEVRVVVDDRVPRAVERGREVRFGNRETDGVGDTLTQRPRGGLHALGVVHLGVTGGEALPLAEVFDLLKREIVAGQVQRAVQQHGRVSHREHEAIAVGPVRRRGVVAQMLRVQRVRQRRERHGGAGVPRLGGLHRVHGEGTNGIDSETHGLG